jgi:hypothetical protein
MIRTKYYTNIDTMPIFNYFKVINDGDFSYLVTKKGLIKNHESALEEIQRQIVKEFGFSESFTQEIEIRKEICDLELEVAITGDKFHNLFIQALKAELNDLKSIKSMPHELIRVSLEKWLRVKINSKETTIIEWYSYLKSYSADQTQNQSQNQN